MKRYSILFIVSMVLLSLSSCGDKMQVCSGKVKDLNDTVMVAAIGEYSIKFNIKNTEYTNGMIMPGDSVTVHYAGDLREKKATALIVKLIPKKGVVVDAVYDPNKELKVSERPMSDKEVEDLEKFAASGKNGSRKK